MRDRTWRQKEREKAARRGATLDQTIARLMRQADAQEEVRVKDRERYQSPRRQAWLAGYRERPEYREQRQEYDARHEATLARSMSRFRYGLKRNVLRAGASAGYTREEVLQRIAENRA